MKLKIIYGLLCVSILGNLVLFDTLGKTVAEVNHLRDLNLVQKEYNIELLTEHISLVNSSRIMQDLGK